jgi:hypothetical protein
VFNPVIPVNFMEKVCAPDAHKDSVFACIPGAKREKQFLEQRFGPPTGELTKLRDIMIACGCSRAA